MSYYIKSKDGKIYSDTIAGGTPFKEAIVVNEVRLDYPDKDVAGAEPYYTDGNNSWKGDNAYNSRYLVPYVAIKDASRPLIYGGATAYGATSIDEVDIGVNYFPEYYRPIAICSYKTRRNTYEITKDKNSDYPVLYFPIRHQTVVQKELYKGEKSMISHCDRTKGNTLYYYISENQKCLNSRWDSKWGPYATDAHNVDSKNAILRCYISWIHDGDLTAAGNPFYSDVQIQNNYLQFFKQLFDYRDNDMFGFSASKKTENPETSDKNRLTYFRLNIDEIKNKGNKLTLKYYWNYLYKNDSQMRTNYDVYGLDKPFVFNYWTGDDEEWPVSTDTTYGYKLNENLKSSLVNGVNTCEGVNTKYTFNMDDDTQKDPWNDVETYNNLWINWVNKGNDGDEKNMVLLKVANNNSALFTKGALGDMSVGNIGTTSYSAMLAGKRYVVNFGNPDYRICVPKNDCPIGTSLTESLFNEIHNLSEYALSSLKETQCYENYTAHFTEQKFLKDQNNWGDYSANFLPYLRTDSNNCIFENTWYGCYFNQYTTNTTPKLVYKMWDAKVVSQFNPSVNDLIKNDNESIYSLAGDTTNLYSANNTTYYNAPPSWKKLYAGDYLKVVKEYDSSVQKLTYSFGKLTADIESQYSIPLTEIYEKMQVIYSNEYDDVICPKIYNYLTANNFFATANMTQFDPTKSYTNGSVVYDKITKYTANCFIKAGYNLNSIAWNENLFNPLNSTVLKPKLSANTSYNYAGSASYTIDLTNETKKYIYVANPTTILLTPSANGMEACDSIITDFKLVYEATN